YLMLSRNITQSFCLSVIAGMFGRTSSGSQCFGSFKGIIYLICSIILAKGIWLPGVYFDAGIGKHFPETDKFFHRNGRSPLGYPLIVILCGFVFLFGRDTGEALGRSS